MTDIAQVLVAKYALTQTPSPDQVQLWASTVESLMDAGADIEKAGHDAAKQVFPELFSS